MSNKRNPRSCKTDCGGTSSARWAAPAAVFARGGTVNQASPPVLASDPRFTMTRVSSPDHASVPNGTTRRADRLGASRSRTSSRPLSSQYAALLPEGEMLKPPAYPSRAPRLRDDARIGSTATKLMGTAGLASPVAGIPASSTATPLPFAAFHSNARNCCPGNMEGSGPPANVMRARLNNGSLLDPSCSCLCCRAGGFVEGCTCEQTDHCHPIPAIQAQSERAGDYAVFPRNCDLPPRIIEQEG